MYSLLPQGKKRNEGFNFARLIGHGLVLTHPYWQKGPDKGIGPPNQSWSVKEGRPEDAIKQ